MKIDQSTKQYRIADLRPLYKQANEDGIMTDAAYNFSMQALDMAEKIEKGEWDGRFNWERMVDDVYKIKHYKAKK